MDSTKTVKRLLTEDEFAELMRPRLQRFLSVDIVASTRLKQRSKRSSGEQDWLPAVFSFLHAFPGELEKAGASQNPGPSLSVWKLLGDEIIFTTEIQAAGDIDLHLAAFVRALADRRSHGHGKFEVKGTAWIAGFPVANSILPLGDGSFDFLGVSIDTGFRLARLSTPRTMAVSVELAWFLLQSESSKLDVRYAGRRRLDGVGVAGGYPAFYVDVSPSELEVLEDRILGTTPAKPSEMRQFCKAFIESHGSPDHLPFIAGNQPFGEQPPTYRDDIRRISEALRKDVFMFDESSPSPMTQPEPAHVDPSVIDRAIEGLDQSMPREDDAPDQT